MGRLAIISSEHESEIEFLYHCLKMHLRSMRWDYIKPEIVINSMKQWEITAGCSYAEAVELSDMCGFGLLVYKTTGAKI